MTDNKEWNQLKSAACCYYDNNPEHGKKGLLYNWWAASHPKIAPKGWHVPSLEEQMAFRRYLGDSHHVKPTGFGLRLVKDKN